MESPKPAITTTVVLVTFAICFVYVMSLGIGKFDSCHKGDVELQKKKDYITTILTIAIIVPATLFGQKIFDSMTGETMSSLPMFYVALGVLSFVGSYFTFQIVTKEKTTLEAQREELDLTDIKDWEKLGDDQKRVLLTGRFQRIGAASIRASNDELAAVADDDDDADGFKLANLKNMRQALEAFVLREGSTIRDMTTDGDELPDGVSSNDRDLDRLVRITEVEAVDVKCGKHSSEKFSSDWWITVVAMILCLCLVLIGLVIMWTHRSGARLQGPLRENGSY